MGLIFAIFLLCMSFGVKSQEVLTIADTMPKFPGGTVTMAKFMQMKINIPAEVRENSGSAKSFVKFVVDSVGKVKSPEIIKSSGYKSFDAEAIRLVSIMPDWQPGWNNGKKASVYMTLPVSYKNIGVVEPVAVTAEHETAMKYWEEGHKLEQQSKFDKALEKYEKALSVEPKNKFALFDKGKMLMALGEKKKACNQWTSMIDMNIRADEASEYMKKYCGENVDKLALFNEIKSNAFFANGMEDVRTGRYESALHKFDSSIKYKPDHTNALFNKAEMHKKLGQAKAACAAWRRLLELNPADNEVAYLIKQNCN